MLFLNYASNSRPAQKVDTSRCKNNIIMDEFIEKKVKYRSKQSYDKSFVDQKLPFNC